MRFALVLLVCCAAVAQGRTLLSATEIDDPLSNTNLTDHKGPESPSYKIVNSTDVYELRKYANATWAVAFGRSHFSTDFAAIQAGFGLAAYFSGKNAAHEKIPKTIPVVGTVFRPPPPPHPKNGTHPKPPPPKNGSRHHGHHHHHHPPGPPAVAIAGFIPKKFEGEAPKPDCPHVKIFHNNASEVYVHEFGGWAISWILGREIKHLADALKEEGICPRSGKFLIASYDGPWKFFGRRNEVWWIKKPKHNETSAGLEGLDVESLFPEEFADDAGGPEPFEGFGWAEEGPDDVMEDSWEGLDSLSGEGGPVVTKADVLEAGEPLHATTSQVIETS